MVEIRIVNVWFIYLLLIGVMPKVNVIGGENRGYIASKKTHYNFWSAVLIGTY